MALALRSEDGTGDGGDVGLFEENFSGSTTVFVDLFDVWEGVKSSGRRFAFEADLVESGDD